MCYKQKCKVVSLNLAHPVRERSHNHQLPKRTTQLKDKPESPDDAGKPARRKTMKKFLHFEVITSSSQVGNPVFIAIKFLIQITSTYNS